MTQVPVTVIGGFLGTGKTTLLNHVLTQSAGVRYAVMVNDFGSLSIDESLITEHNGDTISFANGCVCCALGDNLVASIDRLLASKWGPEHFLVEVSGVANPKAIADVATLHPGLRRDLIVTLVDAQSIDDRLNDPRLGDTLVMQLTPADLIVLNKCDLVSPEQIDQVHRYLEQHYTGKIVTTVQARLPMDVLSDRMILADDDPVVGFEQNATWSHNPETQFHRLTIELPKTLRTEGLKALLQRHRSQLLRAKGFVLDNDEQLVSIQLSGKRVDIGPLANAPKVDTPTLVVIGLSSLEVLKKEILEY